MNIDTRVVDGISILNCTGSMTLGEGSRAIHDAVQSLLDRGANDIVLDLAGITYIDSSGVGELVNIYAAVSNKGGRFALLHVSKRARELLDLTRLLKIFQTFDSEREVLAGFKSPGPP